MNREFFHLSCFLLHCLSVLVCTSEVGTVQGRRWTCVSKACKMWHIWKPGLAKISQVSKVLSVNILCFGVTSLFSFPEDNSPVYRLPCICSWLVLCRFSSEHQFSVMWKLMGKDLFFHFLVFFTWLQMNNFLFFSWSSVEALQTVPFSPCVSAFSEFHPANWRLLFPEMEDKLERTDHCLCQ